MSLISSVGSNEPQTQINNVTPITPTSPVSGAGLSGDSSGLSTSSDYGSIFLNRRTLENLGLPAIDHNVDNINLKAVSVALATLIDKISSLAAKSGIQGASNEIQNALSALKAYETSLTLVNIKNTELNNANTALETAIAGLTQTVDGTAQFSEGSLTAESTAADALALLAATTVQLQSEQSSLASLQSELEIEQSKNNPNAETVSRLQTAIAASEATIASLEADKAAFTLLLPYFTSRDQAATAYQAAIDTSDQLHITAIQTIATAAISVAKAESNNPIVISADDATLEAIDELVADIKDAAKRRALEGLLAAIVDAATNRGASGPDKPGAGILSDRRSDGTYSIITKGGLTALLALNPASMTLENFLTAVNAGGSASRLKRSFDALASLDDLTKKKIVADIADILNRLKVAVDAIKSVSDLIAAANKQDEPIVKVSL